MIPVRELDFPHRLYAFGSGHWRLKELSSTEPLTPDAVQGRARPAAPAMIGALDRLQSPGSSRA